MFKLLPKRSFVRGFLCMSVTTFVLASCGGNSSDTAPAAGARTPDPRYLKSVQANPRSQGAASVSSTDTTAASDTTVSSPTTTIATTTGRTVVTPYYDVWPGGIVSSLTQAQQVAGLNRATIGFAFSDGTCAFDPIITKMFQDIRDFTAKGGTATLSFGGGGGVTFIETACTNEDSLFNAIDGLIQQTGVRKLDFDVEGAQISNLAATTRRTHVLARLQAKYPDMGISFTLPVAPSGLIPDALNIVKDAVNGGVRIDIVNIMTMDYEMGSINWGDMAIQSAQSTFNQLKAIYPNKTNTELYGMIGITPMIGLNDDGSIFSQADATQLTDFAKFNGIGQLSYWAFQRDQAQTYSGTSDIGYHSGVIQSNFEFYRIFKAAE